MARILVLTDRPQTDDQIFSRAVELAHRLDSREVSVVLSCGKSASLVTGCSFGNPDTGVISPETSSVWSLSLGRSDASAERQFLSRCRQDAAFYGLTCETARSDTSLRRTAAMLANVVGLMMVSRETLLDDGEGLLSLRMMWRDVQRPWVICPTNADSWKRVVVAARDDDSRDEMIAWGRHWSERFDVPLVLIELGDRPPQSVWSSLTRWLSRGSSRRHRETVRQRLLSYGLDGSDLLLVDREPAIWPNLTDREVWLDDVIAAAPCSVGVAPTIIDEATCELLFPHGLAHIEEPILDIVSA